MVAHSPKLFHQTAELLARRARFAIASGMTTVGSRTLGLPLLCFRGAGQQGSSDSVLGPAYRFLREKLQEFSPAKRNGLDHSVRRHPKNRPPPDRAASAEDRN